MEKLVYALLAAGIIGNIAVYYGLYRIRKSNEQHRDSIKTTSRHRDDKSPANA